MAAACFGGPCLPWFAPGARDLHGIGPASPEEAQRREAWLEAEVGRLHNKFRDLVETHDSLNREIVEKQEAEERAKAPPEEDVEEVIDLVKDNDDTGAKPVLGRRPTFSHREEVISMPSSDPEAEAVTRSVSNWLTGNVNAMIMKGSASGLKKPVQVSIYTLAVAGVLFVLLAAGLGLGAPGDQASSVTVAAGTGWADPEADGDHGSAAGHASASQPEVGHDGGQGGHGRLLVGAAPPRMLFGAVPRMLRSIAFALTGVGFMTLLMNFIKQPLILGYLLGGALVGPEVLGIIDSHEDIAELSALGLVFLLFMIGMELDLKELLKMGKVVLLTGFLQFPICAGVMLLTFMAFNAMGLTFGTGDYATLYCALTCGISSTMIVAKVLGEKGEMGSEPGRLTIGILIFQDIWAIIVLAIQPKLANPEILGIVRTFAMIAVLICIAMAYAKFVMPAVLFYASKSVELMLVLSLTWCFFICCTAILPFIGLSMELAALIAGVAIATYPYSAEFNGKIKYIRDFFITLFFAALGMQIPVPTPGAVLKGVLVAVVVLAFRWLGIFAVVRVVGGGPRLAAISTINLSQISEFALVICSLGISFGHVNSDTMTIIIWTFAILAISASYLIGFNARIFKLLRMGVNRCMCRPEIQGDDDGENEEGEQEERDVVFLGFQKVAAMLIAEFQMRNPEILKRIHIIDVNQHIVSQLEEKGVKCSYGDPTATDVLEHAQEKYGEARIVISTIPDSLLIGTTNTHLLKVAREVWPEATVIVTADNPYQAQSLYNGGADYVLRMAKLCAERLQKMLSEHFTQAHSTAELQAIFGQYRAGDADFKQGTQFLSVKV